MKYPKINSLVPEGEHADMEAMNEGIWLSEKHVNNIEKQLQSDPSAELTARVESLTQEVTKAQTELADSKKELDEALEQNANQLTQIEELKAALLGFEQQKKDDDENSTGKDKYLNNSYNTYLRGIVAKRK